MSTTKDASKVPAPAKVKSKKAEKSEEEALFDGFLTEVEDDLREEEFKKLWAKYGGYVIGAVAAVIFGVLGWQLWRQNVETKRIEVAKQYEAASKLLQDGKMDEALTAYAAVAAEKGQGYAALAQLQKAAIALEKNDREGALAAYRALADDTNADPLFRDLGLLLRALHGIDGENPLELEASLKPLLDPANPFSFSATELTALLAQKQGDTARALQLVEGLIADTETPQGIRQRAQELSAVFKGAAAVAPPSAPAPATNQ
ncbi:MAG: tetratricopeptide repeat protein [Rhodospirillaceae bacterium]|nr:tetratricopeptide repeat protein [Rhodospirillaceae bacterium]